MPLKGSEFQQLQQALLSAFPTQPSLSRMVRIGLDQNLEVIAGTGKLADVVDNLITWAETNELVIGLVIKAREANPWNTALQVAMEALTSSNKQTNSSPASLRDIKINGNVAGSVIITGDNNAVNTPPSGEQPIRANSINPPSEIDLRDKNTQENEVTSDDDLHYNLADQPWYSDLPDDEPKSSTEGTRQSIDVVLLTAVGRELDAVLRLLKPLVGENRIWRVIRDGQTYYLGLFGAQNAAVTMCRMGDTGPGGATLTTARAIMGWNPKVVIMVGIAFGKDSKKQKMGDVLISAQVAYYGIQAVRPDGTLEHRGDITPCGRALIDRFRNARRWKFSRPDGKACSVIDGQILSGPILLNNAELKAKLFASFPYAIGGEMEAVGVYSAASELKTEWIVVKAICDWGDGNKGDKHQDLAAAASASLVEHILLNPYALDDIDPGFVRKASHQNAQQTPQDKNKSVLESIKQVVIILETLRYFVTVSTIIAFSLFVIIPTTRIDSKEVTKISAIHGLTDNATSTRCVKWDLIAYDSGIEVKPSDYINDYIKNHYQDPHSRPEDGYLVYISKICTGFCTIPKSIKLTPKYKKQAVFYLTNLTNWQQNKKYSISVSEVHENYNTPTINPSQERLVLVIFSKDQKTCLTLKGDDGFNKVIQQE